MNQKEIDDLILQIPHIDNALDQLYEKTKTSVFVLYYEHYQKLR